MNSCNFVGRLCKDPELKYTQNSMAVCKYTIAVQRRFKKDTADFINVVAFKESAEFVSNYFKKGMRVFVSGEMQTGSYEGEDGVRRYTTDIIQQNCGFADGAHKTEGSGQEGQKEQNGFAQVGDDDEDLPF